MSELDPQARDLIGLALEGEGPTSGERSRLRGAVLARVGAGVAVLSTASGTAAATATGVGALSLAAKVVVAVALASAAGAGGYAAVSVHGTKLAGGAARASTHATAPVTIGAPGPVVAVPAPPPVVPGAEPALESPPGSEQTRREEIPATAAPASPHLPAARHVLTARAPTETTAGPTTTDRAAPPPGRSLDEETRALRSAIADLRDGHADRALAAIDAQESRFPGGALAEERAAARIVTLCTLGRSDEARADASRFLRAHPHSLLAGRVLASCGGSGTAGPSPEL
jgi:hypothetical protein